MSSQTNALIVGLALVLALACSALVVAMNAPTYICCRETPEATTCVASIKACSVAGSEGVFRVESFPGTYEGEDASRVWEALRSRRAGAE